MALDLLRLTKAASLAPMAGPDRATQLVRCDCGQLVALVVHDKSACPNCGRVYGTWTDYLRVREKGSPSSEGTSEGALYRPSGAAQPASKRLLADTELQGPISQAHLLSLVTDPYRPPLISCLVGNSGPSTVLRFIITVVVNAFNRVLAGWTRPHVGEEVDKRTPPAVADLDASGSVVLPGGAGDAVASIDHPLPDFILRHPAASVESVALHSGTAAALSISSLEIGGSDDHDVSAVTAADPSRGLREMRKRREVPELAPFMVVDLHRILLSSVLLSSSFRGYLPLKPVLLR